MEAATPVTAPIASLENRFFRRIDQELILKIQEQHQLEGATADLALATELVDSHLLDELIEAKISPRTLLAFSLFPAVYVAWADGSIAPNERDALMKAADLHGIRERSPAAELLREWLSNPPDDTLLNVWKTLVVAMHETLNVATFELLHEAAIGRAKKSAEAAGGFLGMRSVSDVENAALEELDAAFRQD